MKRERFRKGGRYFLLSFYDENLQLPSIATYVYVGADIFGGDTGARRWFFQTAESFARDGIFAAGVAPEKGALITVSEDMRDDFISLEELISRLRALNEGS